MIQITLTFSSIAQAVAALRDIPENSLIQVPRVVDKTPEKVAGKPAAAEVEKPKSKPAAPAADTSAAETKADAPEVKAEEGVLDYAVLQKAVFALAGKSKEAALEVNSKFGVKTMKDLPESKRREALAAVNAKIAELAEAVA